MAQGVIRRIGLVPNHFRLGVAANGMTVWDVDDDEAEKLGAWVGALDFVSHCYLRPRALPDWPYNLYTMVHSTSKEECLDAARRLSMLSGIKEYRVLFSDFEYKKTSARI